MYKIANQITEIEEIKKSNKYINIVFGIVYSLEHWGANNNGDAFPWKEMQNYYKTFENAYCHLEHNKDDKIGYVKKSMLDYEMKRIVVEVVIDLTLLPKEAYDRIITNRAIASSMGCKPEYDVCSICGNISYSWGDKCTHIRNELLSFNEEKQRLVYMINYKPIWDDVSIVAFPGDLRAYSIYYINDNNYKEYKIPIFNFKAPEIKRYRRITKDEYLRLKNIDKKIGLKTSADIIELLEKENNNQVLPDEFILKYKNKAPDVLYVAIKNGILLTNRDLEKLFENDVIYIGEYNSDIEKEMLEILNNKKMKNKIDL